jgi:hypothetical protein
MLFFDDCGLTHYDALYGPVQRRAFGTNLRAKLLSNRVFETLRPFIDTIQHARAISPTSP